MIYEIIMKPSKLPLYYQRFIERYPSHRYIPSFEDLKEILWVNSKNTVSYFLQYLMKEGLVIKRGSEYIGSNELLGIPFYEERVPAGFPSPWIDDSKHNIDFNSFLVERPHASYTVRVKGESMKDAGIFDGDMVIVDRSLSVNENDIVIAQVDDGFTIKYYQKDKLWKPYLQPANKDFENIYPVEELVICGVVSSIIRKLK